MANQPRKSFPSPQAGQRRRRARKRMVRNRISVSCPWSVVHCRIADAQGITYESTLTTATVPLTTNYRLRTPHAFLRAAVAKDRSVPATGGHHPATDAWERAGGHGHHIRADVGHAWDRRLLLPARPHHRGL